MTGILFVCTANVSRSPYAQYRMTQAFGDQVRVASAGIPGTEGRPMDPAMEAELPFEDAAALAHRSRAVTEQMLRDSDLVLTMEFVHHMRIIEAWPELESGVFGLGQFVDGLGRAGPLAPAVERVAQVRAVVGPDSMTWDVADPHGRGSRVARACARELDRLVLALGRGLGYEPIAED